MTLRIERMLTPDAYPHPVEALEVVETHISWVVLTGPRAYKIKKPLELGFLDYSTLERRLRFCHEEVRLNRRLAPELYLGVSPIGGTPERPRVDGEGPAFEHAVRMRQFDQDRLLDRLVARGELDPGRIDEVAAQVADFHQRVERAPRESRFGRPEVVHAPVAENFTQTLPRIRSARLRSRLERLAGWSEEAYRGLAPLMAERKSQGWVRECHGDLHLGNMAEVDGRVLIFDGIEFSEDLRWIDVMAEMAFLFVDLEHRCHPEHAWRALNGWLERTGDYGGMALLAYYAAYRAMVRAKVSAIRFDQPGLSEEAHDEVEREFLRYLSQAEGFTEPGAPALVLMRGLSGSGKSWLAARLSQTLGAVCIRSDVERKRLFGLPPEARTDSSLDGGIYTSDASCRTFRRLREIARDVLRAGHRVIVDATFLERSGRDPFRSLAEELDVPFRILDVQAPEEVLRERVARRREEGTDPSEAGVAVLERQLADYGPVSEGERACTLVADGVTPDLEGLARALGGH